MKIVILGGGLTGLSAGERLSKNHEVIVIEKSDQLGGLAASFDYQGERIPKYYHHVFKHDYITRKYLGQKLKFKKIKMSICANNKLYNFTNLFGLLKFDYLSFFGRIRYGLFGAYVFSFMNPVKIKEELDAKEWLEKIAGKEVTEKLFYQLYARNKFGIPLENISAKQFANRLKAKEALGKFGFPENGLDGMIKNLSKDLKIMKKVEVKEIDLETKEIKIGNKKIKYDIVINTIPIPEFLKIAKGLPEDYREKLSKIKYCPVVGVVFGTKKLLNDYYWMNMLNEDAHMIIQHSWLHDKYNAKVSWVSRYGGSEEDFVLDDKEIMEKYLNVVKKYFPESEIVWSIVFKTKYASPIYDKNYFKFKPGYLSPVKGLFNAGIAVTYPKIRNMNTALESGLKVAEIIEKGKF